jgi:hypothetical protein
LRPCHFQDQWQKKKQAPEDRAKARKAKLNPNNIKTAKDVMDENERKRKRELEADGVDDDDSSMDGPGKEKPREGLKTERKNKKQKTEKDGKTPPSNRTNPLNAKDEQANKNKAEKRREKRQRQKELAAQMKREVKEKKARRKQARVSGDSAPRSPIIEPKSSKQAAAALKAEPEAKSDGWSDDSDEEDDDEPVEMPDVEEDAESKEEPEEQDANNLASDDGIEKLDVSGLVQEPDAQTLSSNDHSPPPDSTFSHASDQPVASSTSSIESPETANEFKRPTKIALPKVDHEALKARLQARIDALRAARKADGPNGQPARTRQDLIEARRKKQELRKQNKKELRKQAKDEEQNAKAEVELARLRGSGSPLTGSDIFSPAATEHINTNFAFGRVTFDDGQRLDVNGNLVDKPRTKGPSDPRTALAAAESKRARLNGFDEFKRKDIETKDLWLNAKKKAHGERVRDDTNLLKKTLKRKEKQKAKSELEWHTRKEGVEKNQEIRQKKREDNLAKRREEKGKKGKNSTKVSKKAKSKQQKKKAFGSFGSKSQK